MGEMTGLKDDPFNERSSRRCSKLIRGVVIDCYLAGNCGRCEIWPGEGGPKSQRSVALNTIYRPLILTPGWRDHTALTIVSFANATGIQIYSIPEFASHLLMLLI